ncbi:MAG TPA: hypothetical protein VF788_14115 [Pseudonocardiaceae bacterium]
MRWSEYLPDGMLADLLAQPAETDPEHREFEALERIGGWERIIAWAQSLADPGAGLVHAQRGDAELGVGSRRLAGSRIPRGRGRPDAEVSARTTASRVDDAWSLSTRLPGTPAALEQGRITLAKHVSWPARR